MTIYSVTILLTELMMLTMTLHVVAYPGFEWKQKRWYLLTFITIMLCAAAEWAVEVYDGRGAAYVIPLTIITVVQFSLTPLIPVFFAGALGMGEMARTASVFFTANGLLEALMAPSGRIFRFDEGVVDFISVKFYGIFGLERWPTFNISDSCVVVFVILFAVSVLVSGGRKEKGK